jgi:hypothetical protein
MKLGYEGIAIALLMLLTGLALIAIVQLMF